MLHTGREPSGARAEAGGALNFSPAGQIFPGIADVALNRVSQCNGIIEEICLKICSKLKNIEFQSPPQAPIRNYEHY